MVSAALALSIGFGLLTGLASKFLVAMLTSHEPRNEVAGLYVAAAAIVFIGAGLWRGLDFAARRVLPVTVALVVASGVIAVIAGIGAGTGALAVLVFLGFAVSLQAVSVLVRAAASVAGAVFFAVVAISGGLAGGAVGHRMCASITRRFTCVASIGRTSRTRTDRVIAGGSHRWRCSRRRGVHHR